MQNVYSRWNKKKLDDISDNGLAIAIINERREKLDPYSILGERLKKVVEWLKKEA